MGQRLLILGADGRAFRRLTLNTRQAQPVEDSYPFSSAKRSADDAIWRLEESDRTLRLETDSTLRFMYKSS